MAIRTIQGVNFDDTWLEKGLRVSQVCLECIDEHRLEANPQNPVIIDGLICGVEGCAREGVLYIDEPFPRRNLKELPTPRTIDDCQQYVDEPFTIFEKIEFSDISKTQLLAKIEDLETRQVPQREVLMALSDAEVTEYWFKNWLHPSLKHFFKASPKDKRGCSAEVIARDLQMDSLRFYENGQQNYTYTLDEIKEYCRV